MIRKFNYTGRRKINREAISLNLVGEGAQRRFTCRVSLTGYDFPPKAHVYLEAYYATEVKRFDLQTVDSVKEPSDTNLKGFSSFPVVYFRLLVVDHQPGQKLILGVADKISPYPQGRKPLLPVQIDNSMKQEWKIVFDDGRPILTMNGNLAGMLDKITNDPPLRYSVLPAALREALSQFIFIEGVDDDPDDEDDWFDWKNFSFNLVAPDVNMTLDKDDPSFNGEEVRDWIDSVVEEFSRFNQFLDLVNIEEESP